MSTIEKKYYFIFTLLIIGKFHKLKNKYSSQKKKKKKKHNTRLEIKAHDKSELFGHPKNLGLLAHFARAWVASLQDHKLFLKPKPLLYERGTMFLPTLLEHFNSRVTVNASVT